MEFPFDINEIFGEKITKIKSNILPEGFTGDQRSTWEYTSKISAILDAMGRASANAQDLPKAITSGERLRNSEHVVYLLTDPHGKRGKGCVVGLLKVGRKKLFMFDATGAHHEIQPLCVLDFYVHESKQRMGCGKTLYEYMLREENISPQHLAIDRPSEKFLGFLYKHYGLSKILPQTNNYVVFEGFFVNHPDEKANNCGSIFKTRSINPFSAELQRNSSTLLPIRNNENEEMPSYIQPTIYGRYAAHKPPSTIGKILQNTSTQHSQQNGTRDVKGMSTSESIIVEIASSPATSCFLSHSSSPVHRDLKFFHSPLW